MTRQKFDFHNKWALITGASSGMGYEFAQQLAQKGCNLLITARSIETLCDLKTILHHKYGVLVEVAPVDLSTPEAPHLIVEYLKQYYIDVDILVNNAGFGFQDHFYHMQQDDLHRMNMVNMVTPANLMNILVQGMIRRGRGGIINVASVAAFQPLPYIANYAATKAYILHLSAAIHQEVRRKGVRVSCLCPGPVDTNFFNVAGIADPVGKMASVESVVKQAVAGFEKNKVIVVPRENSKGLFRLGPFVPTKTKLKIAEKLFNH